MPKTKIDKEVDKYRKNIKSKFFLSEPQLNLACQGYKDGIKFQENRITDLEIQNEALKRLFIRCGTCDNWDDSDKNCFYDLPLNICGERNCKCYKCKFGEL